MTLFWCLCVWLVLGVLAFRQTIRAALEGLRLRLFGAPVRVPVRQPLSRSFRRVALPSRHAYHPPFRVTTRPGP
jgi:hypothetical protein